MAQSNANFPLFTGLIPYSCRAGMYSVTGNDFTSKGTVDVLVNQFILTWVCPKTLLIDSGLQFCPKLSQVCVTSSWHSQYCNELVSPV